VADVLVAVDAGDRFAGEVGGRLQDDDIVDERSWQRRQLSWRISAFFGPIMMGSWKFSSVKAEEWFQPFRALATILGTKARGRWQSLQPATWWCPERDHESYWSFMMWQFVQARGSLEKYESPSA
jgi:hypothetical protein